AQQRELGHRLALRVGELSRARAVEALRSDQLAQVLARAAQILDLLVRCWTALVEDLEHLVLLRFGQAERAQLHRMAAASTHATHAAAGHRLRRGGRDGVGCEPEREAARE